MSARLMLAARLELRCEACTATRTEEVSVDLLEEQPDAAMPPGWTYMRLAGYPMRAWCPDCKPGQGRGSDDT